MRILVTNDDGFNAIGIKTLYHTLKTIPDCKIVVVAPTQERSTTGHTLTLNKPMKLQKLSKNFFAFDGHPADCVLLGLTHLLKDLKVDLVVSGINRGPNLGQDVYYSGTVAAAREGTFNGIKSVAISCAFSDINIHDDEIFYHTAADFMKSFIEHEGHKLIDPMVTMNVNIPNLEKNDIKGVKISSLGFRNYSKLIKHHTDVKKDDYYCLTGTYQGGEPIEGSDSCLVEQNYISITPLTFFTKTSDVTSKWSRFIKEEFKY